MFAKTLYKVLASDIGLKLGSKVGSKFFYGLGYFALFPRERYFVVMVTFTVLNTFDLISLYTHNKFHQIKLRFTLSLVRFCTSSYTMVQMICIDLYMTK